MKKTAVTFLLLIVMFVISACPPAPNPGGSNNPDNPGGQRYTKEFLGEWIRMDSGERWYISENSISVNGAAFNRTVTLVKKSAQVITVSEAGRADYFLFASRIVNGSFNARVVMIDEEGAGRSAGGSRAAIPGGGFIVKPPNNPGQEQTVYPNPDTGEIIVDDIIPGDPVEITPEDPEWEDINVGLTPEDGQDMGIIPIARGVNLKTSIRLANPGEDIRLLYADGIPRDFIIEIENIGTSNTTGASYELITRDSERDIDFNRDFVLGSGSTTGLLDTIRPGEKREIRLSLASKPIEGGRREKKIGIRITSYDTQVLQTKHWDDTVSVNYYKTRVQFNFRSEKPVQGVIKAPGGRTYYFKTEGSVNNYYYSIYVPWSNENYIIAFLGASANTLSETRYSLAIDDQPPSNWDSLTGAGMFLNEPANDIETTAPVLDMDNNKTFMGYLHDGDIDYYRINLGATLPPSPPSVSAGNRELSVSWQAVEDALSYEVWFGTTNSSANAEKYGADVYGTSATITGLTNGTTYYVWIRAKNNQGTSGFSPAASGVPRRTPGLYRGNEKIGNQNLNAALTYISANAVLGDNYLILLGGDESVPPMTLDYSGKTVGITLLGYDNERKITLTSSGSLFTINSGVTLTLDENITLVGLTANNNSLVNIDSGNLVINAGAKISGNSANSSSGGGIRVKNGGTVTMNGGTISGNTAGQGGGISVVSGTFTMHGGIISGNTADYGGGGILASGGTVTINGGTISGNTTDYSGGGVYFVSGTFTMNGGTISGNTADYGGGGISVDSGTFTMHGGIISGNTADYAGGGVFVRGTGTVTMHGGVISGNTTKNHGGGVCVDNTGGTFKKLPSTGGGQSGIIYGYGATVTGVDANGVPLRNTNAVFLLSNASKRNTTAGQTDHIDSTTGRGLSANGNPPFGE